MPLENLYTGYRKNVMQADEVLAWIVVPKAMPVPKNQHHACKVYKISKRFEDDISAVCLALDIHTEKGVVTQASIGVGGVAATPVRARATEKTLLGQAWNAATVQEAMHCLRNEFTPISDMRASSHYRQDVLGNLLWRFWLESQGQAQMDLQTLQPLGWQREPAGASA
jgi:xanthine dehydrogenase small subunit